MPVSGVLSECSLVCLHEGFERVFDVDGPEVLPALDLRLTGPNLKVFEAAAVVLALLAIWTELLLARPTASLLL